MKKAKMFIIMLMLLIAVLPTKAAAENNKDDVYKALTDKYSGIETVSFNFVLEETPDFFGSIKATTGNKYRIVAGLRTITCDGKTIWNYTKDDNKVVISSYEAAAEGELSIENFFFNFLKNYKPVSLKNVNTSTGAKAFLLKLEPDEKAMHLSEMELTSVQLWIDRNNYTLLSVQVDDGSSVQTWGLQNIKINSKIPDKEFTFDIPKDAQVIDLR